MLGHTFQWREIDATNRPHYLSHDDKCFFFMDYKARGGFNSSPANNRIDNFKKPPKHRGQAAWDYKLIAIGQFAQDLSILFQDNEELTIAFIPSSKPSNHPEYDERFDLLKDKLSSLRPKFRFVAPVKITSERSAAHLLESRSSPAFYKSIFEWVGLEPIPSSLILIDDVITTGAQFRAYKDFVLQHHPEVAVFGVFWGKTFWDPFSEFAGS
jgi:hypothetical protein